MDLRWLENNPVFVQAHSLNPGHAWVVLQNELPFFAAELDQICIRRVNLRQKVPQPQTLIATKGFSTVFGGI